MTERTTYAVDIALLHHPVAGKNGDVIGSAVTNIDIHDIARIARTYGIGRFFIVTPYSDQQDLVQEIIDHWQTGHGATSNPARKKAFEVVSIVDSMETVISEIKSNRNCQPEIVTTSAKELQKSISYNDAKKRMSTGVPTLLVFGTAHGLTEETLSKAEYGLPAITTEHGYNHLSVRSAVAIICDRLFGKWQ